MVTVRELAGAPITVGAGVPPHAVEEWRLHLARIAGEAAGDGLAEVRIEAGGGAGDGFDVSVQGQRLTVAGDSPRGAINGVAWTLEKLGFGWPEPAAVNVAFRSGGELADGEYRQEPSFARRTLILGQDAFHDEWRDWLEWASRNRMNCVFFHDTPPSRFRPPGSELPTTAGERSGDGGGWLFERWDADGAAIREATAERHMTLQFGGHHLPTLLPRERHEEHPDWFPLRNSVRDSRYNLCVSAPGAITAIQAAAREFVERFAGADVYHFWGDDIRGGGWCSCGGCAMRSPSAQALTATNAIAEALESRGIEVAHLAYHDTLVSPEPVAPRENVQLLFAPRERDYSVAINAAECARNAVEHWRPLLDAAPAFGGRLSVFEYYSDSILFKGLAPPHLMTMPADLRAYAAAGVTDMQNLLVSDRPWVGPPFHAWLTSRAMWDANLDVEAAVDEFCAIAFAGHATAMASYYRESDKAMRNLLALHDTQQGPRHDVLDFHESPRQSFRAKAAEALDAVGQLERTAGAMPTRSADDRLSREREQARFVTAMARHLASRTAALDAALDGRRSGAAAHLEDARTALAAVEAWDAEHNTAAFAIITHGMRRGARYHLRQVERVLADG